VARLERVFRRSRRSPQGKKCPLIEASSKRGRDYKEYKGRRSIPAWLAGRAGGRALLRFPVLGTLRLAKASLRFRWPRAARDHNLMRSDRLRGASKPESSAGETLYSLIISCLSSMMPSIAGTSCPGASFSSLTLRDAPLVSSVSPSCFRKCGFQVSFWAAFAIFGKALGFFLRVNHAKVARRHLADLTLINRRKPLFLTSAAADRGSFVSFVD